MEHINIIASFERDQNTTEYIFIVPELKYQKEIDELQKAMDSSNWHDSLQQFANLYHKYHN